MRFVGMLVPQAEVLGITLPDPDLRFDEATGQYVIGEIDWTEFNEILAGNGPCNAQRIQHRRDGARGRRVGARGGGRVRDASSAATAERGGRVTTPGADETEPWPLWEVFVRANRGLSHVHVGSLHAPDPEMAVRNARDVYTRRNEGVSIWVVPAEAITTSDPDARDAFFESPAGKNYRHARYYDKAEGVKHL